MASELNSVTSAQLRQRCRNITTDDYDDAGLDAIITDWEHTVMKKLGRVMTNPLTIADDDYEIFQICVKEGAASQVLASLPESDNFAKLAVTLYTNALATLIEGPTGSRGKISKSTGST